MTSDSGCPGWVYKAATKVRKMTAQRCCILLELGNTNTSFGLALTQAGITQWKALKFPSDMTTVLDRSVKIRFCGKLDPDAP